jgi:hypothetical protein
MRKVKRLLLAAILPLTLLTGVGASTLIGATAAHATTWSELWTNICITDGSKDGSPGDWVGVNVDDNDAITATATGCGAHEVFNVWTNGATFSALQSVWNGDFVGVNTTYGDELTATATGIGAHEQYTMTSCDTNTGDNEIQYSATGDWAVKHSVDEYIPDWTTAAYSLNGVASGGGALCLGEV